MKIFGPNIRSLFGKPKETVPVISSPSAHKARMSELRDAGYKTKIVTLPGGDRVVLRSKSPMRHETKIKELPLVRLHKPKGGKNLVWYYVEAYQGADMGNEGTRPSIPSQSQMVRAPRGLDEDDVIGLVLRRYPKFNPYKVRGGRRKTLDDVDKQYIAEGVLGIIE